MNENSNKIKIKIITHEKVVFEENVDELYVKTTDGALGILPNHVPVVCALDIGVTRVIKDKEPICITTMGGVLQFSENEATILTDIAEYLNGVACQTYPAKVHSIPVLKIRELSQGYCDDNSDRASCIPEKFVINGGEIIFSWSATLFIDIWCGEVCALNQHLFKVVPLGYPKWFVSLSTQRHIQTWKNLISAKATSMGHIKREDLENALVFLPPSQLLIEQDKMFSCLFEYHFRLRREILKLKELQSLLLAKIGQ